MIKISTFYCRHLQKKWPQESLTFSNHNFDIFFFQSERHIIMQVVCEATQSTNPMIRVAALQCLVKIMSLYYQYMEFYMGPALFAVSCKNNTW